MSSDGQTKFFESGFGELALMLIKQLDTIAYREKLVNVIIQRFASPKMLSTAKERATKAEMDILHSLLENILQLSDFLTNTIRIENTFNNLYKLHKASQIAARSKYAPNMSIYEKIDQKRKRKNNVSSFVELMIKCKLIYFEGFKQLISDILDVCDKKEIFIYNYNNSTSESSDTDSKLNEADTVTTSIASSDNSDKLKKIVSIKKMDRAFFKTFYIYKSDHNRLCDVLRASLVFNTFEDLYNAFAVIEQCIGTENILCVKDRFMPENVAFGYRDICINIYCPNSNKRIICELQLHHLMFYKHKKLSHKMYKKARLFENAITDTNAAYNYAIKYLKPIIGNQTIDSMSSTVNKNNKNNNNNSNSNNDSYQDLLKKWDLSEYCDNFRNMGYDDATDWIHLSEKKLIDILQMKEGHAKRFLRCYSTYYQESEKMDVKTQAQAQAQASDEKKDQASSDDDDEFDLKFLEIFMEANAQHMALVFTELDDAPIYKKAQNLMNDFKMGVALKLRTKPTTSESYAINFIRLSKYGLNQIISQYLIEASKDYKEILKDVLMNDTYTFKNNDDNIIDIITEYVKPLFTINDLLNQTNSYNETALVFAAKYGQTETVRIIVNYANMCDKIDINNVINHSANGGNGVFWLLRCYSLEVFEAIKPQIKPTLYLLLQSGAKVSTQYGYGPQNNRIAINAAQLAKYRKLNEEAQVIEAFIALETGKVASINEYIKANPKLSADVIESLEAILNKSY